MKDSSPAHVPDDSEDQGVLENTNGLKRAVQRVVVVGGGIGGVSTAGALRAGGYDGEIVLVDPAEFPYDRPPLSKGYLSGTQDLKDIALQPHEWYDTQRIDLRARTTVTKLLPSENSVGVFLDDGDSIEADFAVLATGGRAALPPIPGLDAARGAGRAHVLREAADADGLRAVLTPGARLLIVGGGLIGAEAASTARQLGCEVVLVDPLDPPLSAAAGQTAALWLHSLHADHGVATVTGSLRTVQVTAEGVVVQLQGDVDRQAFDAILVGTGMAPVTELAQAAGLDVDRGVVVDDRQVTSHPRVLAVGDAALVRGGDRIEHWEAAQHGGQRAAATILGAGPPEPVAPWWWTDRYDRHVEGVGRMVEPDSQTRVVVRGTPGVAPFSIFTVRDGRVVGAIAVDEPNAVRAARRLIDRETVVDPDMLADPGTDLRKLVRG